MQRIPKKSLIVFFFLISGLTLLTAYTVVIPIVLVDTPLPFKPAGFYIANVIDERTDKSAVAQLVTINIAGKPETNLVDFQGGTAIAVGQFIVRNLAKDISLRAVIIEISELKLVETPLANGDIDGRIRVRLSFGLKKDYGTAHLTNYLGSLHYIRSIANTPAIEPHLRSALTDGLVYFNNWMDTNTDKNRALAKRIRFIFSDYTEQPEGDTIYYSANRPLTWADFQSHIQPGEQYEAEVMPVFGYDYSDKIVKGVINIHLSLKPSVAKSACSAKPTGRDAYYLNHEQRHFDIAKIIAEQFKQKILAAHLTPDTYEGFINMQYFDSLRDMNAMQKSYDKETGHGVNHTEQQAWNQRIDSLFKQFSNSP